MKRSFNFILLFVFLTSFLCAELPDINQKTTGMKKYPGYFPFYWDADAGKIWLEINKIDTEFLYVSSLPAGIGSTSDSTAASSEKHMSSNSIVSVPRF
jgi:hypothetical protein